MPISADETRTRGHKKKARTRRALLDAAVEVVGEHGDAFSISDVADRAGVSNGTFYNYFADRDALIDDLAADLITAFADDSAVEVRIDDPALRFATITARAFRRAAETPDAMRAILRLDLLQRVVLRDGPLRHLAADLAEGAESERFTITHADAVLVVVAGAIVMASRRTLEAGPDPDRDRGVIEHLLRSLGVEGDEAGRLAAEAIARR